ncbi:MAG: META domain-containing protein [Muribaculaceae bacterium]|nr:META domain-containing protein [Muribaculaceae bacterium]
MKKLFGIALLAFALASCGGKGSQADDSLKDKSVAEAEQSADLNIIGQWYIENIVFSDTDYVRPSEQVPDSRQYILFEDSTYSVMTNCNHGSGGYVLRGDSISFGDGAWTEMACDNMATEDAIKRILPALSIIEMENDSIIRINSDASSKYLILRKATETK